MSRCKRCGAEIIFATLHGDTKVAPLDARPVRENYGNIHLDKSRMTYVVLRGEVLENARARNFELHTNHLGTCPYQEQANQKEAECRQAEMEQQQ